MDLFPKSRLQINEVRKFILIFYTVGVIGFLVPQSRNIFTLITPVALLLGTYLLAVYHAGYSGRTLLAFALIFLSGFFIEVAGVKTHAVFGSYSYGRTLGIRLFETPLLIGINWLFLTYSATSVVSRFVKRDFLIVLTAPLLMLGYDLLLEQAAPKMDMWQWQDGTIPVRNYIAWYITGCVFTAILRLFRVEVKNPLALILFVCQAVFFTLLSILL